MLLAARSAMAQETDPSIQRRLLLDRAQLASDAGDHASALDLAQRAGQIQMSAALRRFEAEEQSALGNVGDGYASANECVFEAERDAPSDNRERVLNGCRALRDQLAARVGRIVLRIAAPPAGTHVRVNEHEVLAALWGVDYVVTPGRLSIVATAPDHVPFSTTVVVAAGHTVPVEIALPANAPLPAVRPTAAAPEQVVVMRSPVALGIAVGGVAVALAGGGVEIASDSEYRALRSDCVSPSGCDATTANARRETIHGLDVAAYTMIAAGAVIAVASGVVWLVSGRPERRPASAMRAPSVRPAGAGVVATF
jgi:hypothetical protein